MTDGVAWNDEITGGWARVTATSTLASTLPAAFLAVNVYRVVVTGCTVVLDPFTTPTPWSIEREEAPATLHESVAVSPAGMLAGVTLKYEMIGLPDAPGGALSEEPPQAVKLAPMARRTIEEPHFTPVRAHIR